MALSVKNPEADRLARELARRRGISLTEAVLSALEAELAREKRRIRSPGTAAKLLETGRRFSRLPTRDARPDAEILGYDEHGVPR
jgi:antitoxin VapB